MKVDWIRIYQVSHISGEGVRHISLIRFLSIRTKSILGAVLRTTRQKTIFGGMDYLNPGVRHLGLTLLLRHPEAYTNPNITSWTGPPEEGGYNHPWPKNNLIDQC